MGGPVQIFHILCPSDNQYGHHRQFLFLIGQLKISSRKPFGQINFNLAGSTYGRLCIMFPHLVQIGKQTWPPGTMGNVCFRLAGIILIFSSESTRPNELLLCMIDV